MISEPINWSALVWSHVWQIGLLGVVVAIVTAIVGRRWPHLAYALWLVVLVKCFVPPLGPTGLFARLTPPVWFDAEWGAPAADAGIESATNGSNGSVLTESAAAPTGRDHAETTAAEGATQAGTSKVRVGGWAVTIWVLGSVLLLGMAIGRGGEVSRRLRRTARPVSDDALAVVERVAERLGLKRSVRVLVTPTDAGPMVAGLWQARVYIPETLLTSLSPSELEAVLAHELSHVRRRDTRVAGLQFAAQIAWWFHPAVWWMNRELTRQRERCCDEEAVAHLNGERGNYARCLVRVLEARRSLEPLWGYPAVRPAELTRRRLEEIMKRKNMTHRKAPYWCTSAAAAVAILALPGASAELAAQQTTEKAAPAAREATTKPPATLEYGDSKPDGKKSLGGSGEAIRFEMPKGVDAVRGIRIHGSRYGLPEAPKEDFEIIFVNDAFDEVLHTEKAPYELFRRGREVWVRVNFKQAVELPEKFWVVLDFHAQQTKGVYVSYDTSTKGEYSRIGLPSDEKKLRETDFGGDWMVQLFLGRPSGEAAK
jgi:beta-lactamase regulating signal transducer with metallopeptidase domain